MASQSVEEYIEAIYRLESANGVANTCDLADQLGVAPPSVTTMIRRLSRDGLVDHVRYYGVKLTDSGREMALVIIRRHRLAERLLTDVLGIPMDRVHETACKLEHVMTGELEERAYQILGEPRRCPHGHLLTGDEDLSLTTLSEAADGDVLCVVKLTDESDEFLQAVVELGLVPGALVEVSSNDGSALSVVINEGPSSVALDIASNVWVQPSGPCS